MKLNRFTVIGLMYIALWVGFAIGDIGEVYNSCSEPNEWHLPIIVLLTFAPLFIVGYLGGNRE